MACLRGLSNPRLDGRWGTDMPGLRSFELRGVSGSWEFGPDG